MKIHVYATCWNEELLLPYFFRHYGKIAELITIYDNCSSDSSRQMIRSAPNTRLKSFDTNNHFDEHMLVEIRNNAYRASRGSADYVIVVDLDEILYHPFLRHQLRAYHSQGVTVPKINGYEMVAAAFPETRGQIYGEVFNGVADDAYSKRVVFDPRLVMNFGPGSHQCFPNGNVKESRSPALKLFNYKYLGLPYVLNRYRLIGGRRSARTRKFGFGVHYGFSPAMVRTLYRDLMKRATRVT